MQWLEKVKANPVAAHWLRAFGRFGGRLGAQFAGAITYFSVLSMVPILMVAFAALGLTVTVFLPDVLRTLKDAITDIVAADTPLGEQVTALVDQAFGSWQAVGIVGLLTAVFVGASWVDSVRGAVHAQMRDVFDVTEPQPNPLVQLLRNVGVLFGFLVLLTLSAAMTTVATAARSVVAGWLALPPGPATEWLLSLVPLGGTLAAGFALFVFVFWVFPEQRVPPRRLLVAAGLGTTGFSVLQFATSALIGVFNRNPAAAVFGSVIVLMLFFNLFATLILLIAAWLGTAEAPAEASLAAAATVARQPTHYATHLLNARLAEAAEQDAADRVPTEVAVRATRVGVGLGVAAGAVLTGAAATVATAVSALRSRHRGGR